MGIADVSLHTTALVHVCYNHQ